MKDRKVNASARKMVPPNASAQTPMMQKVMGRFRQFMSSLTKTENGNYYVPAYSRKRGKNYKKIGLGKIGGGTNRQRRVREGKSW